LHIPGDCCSCAGDIPIVSRIALARAYACFEETTKGSIVPGKLADLVLLSGDPIEVAPEDMKDLEVETTIVDGEIVWRKGL